MNARSVLITGGSSGLGFSCARHLARLGGHHVALGAPNVAAAEAPARRLRASGPRTEVSAVELDLGSLASVRGFPGRLVAAGVPPLDAVVCNAGVQYVSGRRQTVDGFEATFAVNHLGHFLLVNLLLPKLAPGARVVVVSSTTHDPSRWTGMRPPVYAPPEQLAYRRPTARQGQSDFGQRAYTTSKLCNLLFAYELARRLPSMGRPDVTVDVYDPGAVPGTGLVRDWPVAARLFVGALRPLLRVVPGFSTARRSGAFMAGLTTGPRPAGEEPRYFSIDRLTRSSDASYDLQKARELWTGSAALVGLNEAGR